MKESSDKICYSLIVLTYERPHLLQNCLNSISLQDFGKSKFEVVVIDDGSVCDNASVVKAFENRLTLSYIKQRHRGISAARNAGIKNSKGDFVSFIADDYCLPKNYLSIVKRFFDNHPNASVITFNMLSRGRGIAPHIQQTYTNLVMRQRTGGGSSPTGVLKKFDIPASRAATFKKKIFEEVGLFNEKLTGGEDFDFSLRMKKLKIPVFFFPERFIEHWENKSYFLFLKQRFSYGTHLFDTLKERKEFPAQNFSNYLQIPFILFFYLPFRCLNTWFSLFEVSLKAKCSLKFILFSPGILLFLAFFYLGFYTSAIKSNRNLQACDIALEGHLKIA